MELYEWLWRKELTKSKVARAIGTHQNTISSMQKKKRTPSLFTALAIEKYTEGEVTLVELLSKKDLEKYENIVSLKSKNE